MILMEDRKKTLRDLEAKKAETLEILDRLHESLGGSLITRLESGGAGNGFPDLPVSKAEGENPRGIWEENQKLLTEIADTEETIKAIETDLSRLGEMEGEINRKDAESAEKTKEMALFYTDLGRLILEDPGFDQFSAPYRQQLEDLFLQLHAREKQLDDLEKSEGNFFARLANGARGWITKSQLTRNETTLKNLYRSAGEKFILSRAREDYRTQESQSQDDPLDNSPEIFDESSWGGEITDQVHKTEELRKLQNSLKDDIARLLKERRETADSLNKEGNPVRRIAGLEKYITRNREEIRIVHRRFGSCIREKNWKKKFISFYSDDDRVLEEKIASLDESLKETEGRIEEVRIAIAVDNENAEIEKLKNVIEEKRRRIAEAEAAIAETEGQIAAAEKHIKELTG